MASDLIEMAREVGGEKLAERVKRLQDEIEEVEQHIETDLDEDQELRQQLIEEGDFSQSAVEDMSLQVKREVAEATELREETTNVRIPVAGRYNEEPIEDEEVTINRSSPDTYTEEVPIPAPMQDPTTRIPSPSDMRIRVRRLRPSMNSIAGSIRRGPRRLVANRSEPMNAARSR